jgi:hypothetical protein
MGILASRPVRLPDSNIVKGNDYRVFDRRGQLGTTLRSIMKIILVHNDTEELDKLAAIAELQKTFWLEREWDFQCIEHPKPIKSLSKFYHQHLHEEDSSIIIQPQEVCDASPSLVVPSSHTPNETFPTIKILKLCRFKMTEKDVMALQPFKLSELHLEQCSLEGSVDLRTFGTLKRLRITLIQAADCQVELPPNLQILFIYCFPSKKDGFQLVFNARNCSALRIM